MSTLMFKTEPQGRPARMQSKAPADSPNMNVDQLKGADLDLSFFSTMDTETFHKILYPLLSCGVCAQILVDPVTLPCGGSLCRSCLPIAVLESGNCGTLTETAPNTIRTSCLYFWTLQHQSEEKWIPPTMRDRFECPFNCPWRHHSREIPSNFVLAKILDSVPYHPSLPLYSEKPQPEPSPLDLARTIHSELDCQICYLLLHDPLTTPCGHTFCRPCLLRTSDHATHPVCPTCRAPVLLPTPQNTPTNTLILQLISTLFPYAQSERAQTETLERHAASVGIDTPIFVCTLALPSVTCFLHIFEPRYRLMLRRCMAGDRRFGMVLPRSKVGGRYVEEIAEMSYVAPSEGGELPTGSRPIFMQFGTMLEIRELQMLPDGRSLVETIGCERFQIHDWSVRDGYIVARTSPVPNLEPYIYLPPCPETTATLTTSVLANTPPDLLPTDQLVYLTRCFVQSLRSVAWLNTRLRDNEVEEQLSRLDSRGDAVRFAWWVGSKMPMEEGEAYSLLLQGGVRELYCVIGGWIGEMEKQSW